MRHARRGAPEYVMDRDSDTRLAEIGIEAWAAEWAESIFGPPEDAELTEATEDYREQLRWLADDTESSISRQHRIDTGRYLTFAEVRDA